MQRLPATRLLPSPLASLCLSLKATRSASEKPSWAVMKLREGAGLRPPRQPAPKPVPHLHVATELQSPLLRMICHPDFEQNQECSQPFMTSVLCSARLPRAAVVIRDSCARQPLAQCKLLAAVTGMRLEHTSRPRAQAHCRCGVTLSVQQQRHRPKGPAFPAQPPGTPQTHASYEGPFGCTGFAA